MFLVSQLLISPSTAATTVLEDAFEVPGGTTGDINIALRRQHGTAAPVAYSLDPASGAYGVAELESGALSLSMPAVPGNGPISGVFLEHSFADLAGERYRIELSVTVDGTDSANSRFTLAWSDTSTPVGNASFADAGLIVIGDGRIFFASEDIDALEKVTDLARDIRGEPLSIVLEFDETRSNSVTISVDSKPAHTVPVIFENDADRTLSLRSVMQDAADDEYASAKIDKLSIERL